MRRWSPYENGANVVLARLLVDICLGRLCLSSFYPWHMKTQSKPSIRGTQTDQFSMLKMAHRTDQRTQDICEAPQNHCLARDLRYSTISRRASIHGTSRQQAGILSMAHSFPVEPSIDGTWEILVAPSLALLRPKRPFTKGFRDDCLIRRMQSDILSVAHKRLLFMAHGKYRRTNSALLSMAHGVLMQR